MSSVVVCISVFFALAVVFVLLRLYTRLVLLKRTGGEDWLVTASLVSLTSQMCFPSWHSQGTEINMVTFLLVGIYRSCRRLVYA
jgi:hypothetical protein